MNRDFTYHIKDKACDMAVVMFDESIKDKACERCAPNSIEWYIHRIHIRGLARTATSKSPYLAKTYICT